LERIGTFWNVINYQGGVESVGLRRRVLYNILLLYVLLYKAFTPLVAEHDFVDYDIKSTILDCLYYTVSDHIYTYNTLHTYMYFIIYNMDFIHIFRRIEGFERRAYT